MFFSHLTDNQDSSCMRNDSETLRVFPWERFLEDSPSPEDKVVALFGRNVTSMHQLWRVCEVEEAMAELHWKWSWLMSFGMHIKVITFPYLFALCLRNLLSRPMTGLATVAHRLELYGCLPCTGVSSPVISHSCEISASRTSMNSCIIAASINGEQTEESWHSVHPDISLNHGISYPDCANLFILLRPFSCRNLQSFMTPVPLMRERWLGFALHCRWTWSRFRHGFSP